MPEPKWIFKTLGRGQTRNDAVGKEFFNLQKLEDQALAREVGQNSLDSNRSKEKLILKINLVEQSSDKIKDNKFISSLYRHSSHKNSGISKSRVPKEGDYYRYLVIEDFNTDGVRGGLEFISDEDEDASKEDVFHLFRSLQKTGKGSDEENEELGSWGMGKNMYAQTSNLGGFMGYSIRQHKDNEFLFGMSILQTHKIGDKQYDSTGNFGIGDIDDINSITKPVTKKGTIEEFKKSFKIERKNEKGLSIVIPCVYNGVSFEMLVKSFTKTWMYAIIKNRMEVHIKSGSDSVVINNNNIENYLYYFDDGDRIEIERKIEYTKLINEAKGKDFITLAPNENMNMPMWKKSNYKENSIASWAKKLEENNKLFYKIPVKIVYKDDKPSEWGEFRLFLFKDPNIKQSDTIQYIRDILIIPGISNRLRLIRGYFAIVQVYGKLAKILTKAEGPAHVEWSHVMENYINQNLKYGQELITFVTSSAAQMKKLMTLVNRGTDESILADLLPNYGKKEKKEKRKKKGKKKPKIPESPKLPSICKDHQVSGGFKITDNDEWEDENMIGKYYTLMMAYDVDDGSAKNAYRPYHFSFNPVRPPMIESMSGLRVIKRQDNRVDFIVEHRNWHYEIKGLNENYQLHMEVKRYDQKI